MRRFCIPLFLAALLCCSVKEVRDHCPCRLEMDLSAFGEVTRLVHVDTGSGAQPLALSGGEDLIYREDLSRRQAMGVAVWSSKPDGDSLYLYCRDLPVGRERLFLKAVPRKQFATVVLYVLPAGEYPVPVEYTVYSDYGAIDLHTGQPVKKALSIPLEGESDHYVFRLPRQDQRSRLLLEAREADGRLHTYPLGEWVRESGYDWEAPDLDDLLVGVDFADATVFVWAADWEASCTIEEIL